mgnify:CR=1 FL=1
MVSVALSSPAGAPAPAPAPASGLRLDVEHVSHAFQLEGAPLPVLDDVSFSAEPGSFVALLGPSGCGKSTVLRMVAGLEDPSNGAMFLDGKEIHGPDKSRGMVFQRYTSFDWMTVQRSEAHMRMKQVCAATRAAVVRELVHQQISLGLPAGEE